MILLGLFLGFIYVGYILLNMLGMLVFETGDFFRMILDGSIYLFKVLVTCYVIYNVGTFLNFLFGLVG